MYFGEYISSGAQVQAVDLRGRLEAGKAVWKRREEKGKGAFPTPPFSSVFEAVTLRGVLSVPTFDEAPRLCPLFLEGIPPWDMLLRQDHISWSALRGAFLR